MTRENWWLGSPTNKNQDPIDRLIALVFDAQGEMTMNELCGPGANEEVRRRAGEQIEAEFEKWFKAKVKLRHLEAKM